MGNGPTNGADPSGKAIITETKEQAEALQKRLELLTGVRLALRQLPSGDWYLDPTHDSAKIKQIDDHIKATTAARNNGGIDKMTELNRHLLYMGAQFGSQINVFVPNSASEIEAGNEGALHVIATDDTSRAKGWASRGTGDFSEGFDSIDFHLNQETALFHEEVAKFHAGMNERERKEFLFGVLQGFVGDGFTGTVEGLWDLGKYGVDATYRAGKSGVEATWKTAQQLSGNPLKDVENFRNNLQDSFNEHFQKEQDFVQGVVEHLGKLGHHLDAVHDKLLKDVVGYLQASSRGEDYTLSPESQRVLKGAIYMATKLGVAGLQLTPQQKGRVVGFLTYQVAETAALTLATDGLAASAIPARVSEKLATLGEKLLKIGVSRKAIDRVVVAFERFERWSHWKKDPGLRLGIQPHARHFPNGAADDFVRWSGRVPNEAGYFDLYVHSTNRGTSFAQLGADGAVEAADVLALEQSLLKAGWKPGQPIRVFSCNVGDPAIGNRAAAKQLSDFLKVEVKAPTEYVTVFEDGTYVISNADKVTSKSRSTGTWSIYGKK